MECLIYSGSHDHLSSYARTTSHAAQVEGTGPPISVCTGAEWHRFPSAFFLPGERYRLQVGCAAAAVQAQVQCSQTGSMHHRGLGLVAACSFVCILPPIAVNLQFIKSGFDGLLPHQFDDSQASGGRDLWQCTWCLWCVQLTWPPPFVPAPVQPGQASVPPHA